MFHIDSSLTNYTYENNLGTTMKQILNQLPNVLKYISISVRQRIQLIPSIQNRKGSGLFLTLHFSNNMQKSQAISTTAHCYVALICVV